MVRTVVLLQWAIMAIGFVLIVTQIFIPLLRHRPLFPLLRPRGLAAETKLAELQEEADVRRIEMEAERVQEDLTALVGEPEIVLRCPSCLDVVMVARRPDDPPDTTMVELVCNECLHRHGVFNGPPPPPAYYNDQGVRIGA